jgi:hypothetical protein
MGLKLNGATSGSVELDVPAAIGSDIEFTLPGADGSAGQVLSTNGAGALSFVNAIAEVDLWYLNANQTSNGTVTNWSRNSFTGAAQIGTGMSHASGVFTFPSTGKWLILANANMSIQGDDSVNFVIEVTTDDSTYNNVVFITDGNGGTNTRNAGSAGNYFLDVTNTSLVKVRFEAASLGANSTLVGNSANIRTHVIFIRLGDT